MFSMPHKEERFLMHVYPLICLSAALGVCTPLQLIRRVNGALGLQRYSLFASGVLLACIVSFSVLLGASRSLALTAYYTAPYRVYDQIAMADIAHYDDLLDYAVSTSNTHLIQRAESLQQSALFPEQSEIDPLLHVTALICVSKEWPPLPIILLSLSPPQNCIH